MSRPQDLLAVAVASVVAVSALKRRREFEEKLALSEALSVRLEAERDAARAQLSAVEHRLLDMVPDFLADVDARKGWISQETDARTEALRGNITRVFREASALDEAASGDHSAGQAAGKAPRMV